MAFFSFSTGEKNKHLLKIYNDEYRDLERYKIFVDILKDHPKFNELLNHVLANEDRPSCMISKHPLLDFDNYLTVSRAPLEALKNELVSLNERFQGHKIKMAAKIWMQDIVLRCEKLLYSMAKEQVVSVSKNSIEQFRAKDAPTENIEEGHLKLKQHV